MSETLDRVRALARAGAVQASLHGAREMRADAISLAELVAGLDDAALVEDYPAYWKGPAVLLLQTIDDGSPVHALWGLEKGTASPAVLVTAYRPDPAKWSADFLRRRP